MSDKLVKRWGGRLAKEVGERSLEPAPELDAKVRSEQRLQRRRLPRLLRERQRTVVDAVSALDQRRSRTVEERPQRCHAVVSRLLRPFALAPQLAREKVNVEVEFEFFGRRVGLPGCWGDVALPGCPERGSAAFDVVLQHRGIIIVVVVVVVVVVVIIIMIIFVVMASS